MNRKKIVFLNGFLFLLGCVRVQQNRVVLPEGHIGEVYTVDYSQDGKFIVSAPMDETAKLWDTGTGKLVFTLKGHKSSLKEAKFTPNGKKILTTASNNQPAVWSAVDGSMITRLKKQLYNDLYRGAEFSNEDKKIPTLVHSSGNTVLWDAETGMATNTLMEEPQENVINVDVSCPFSLSKFSHNNNYIVGNRQKNNSANIRDVIAGRKKFTLDGHKNLIEIVEISYNDKYIPTSAADSSYRFWEAETCNQIQHFPMVNTTGRTEVQNVD